MARAHRSGLALASLVTLIAGTVPLSHALADIPGHASQGVASCPAGLPARTVCHRALGVAVTPPAGWTVPPPGHFPPSSLVFWTASVGQPDATLHLVISALGPADTRDPGAAAAAGADAETQGVTIPVTPTATTVAGIPAVVLQGTPGGPAFGQEMLVAHDGLLYGIFTFDNARTALTTAQRQALASLRFIPRAAPHPPFDPSRPLIAALQDPCLDLTQGTPSAVPAARVVPRLRLTSRVSPARGNDMAVVTVAGTGVRPGERVTLTTCWNTGDQPTYTRYQTTMLAPATTTGIVGASIALYVPSGTFAAWTVRAIATETGTGRVLATATRMGRERPATQGLQLQPHSAYVAAGHAYPFRLYTHCGIDFATDFDHAFWDVADAAWRGSNGNPPSGIGNPFQMGTMTLVDRGHARFDIADSGSTVSSARGGSIRFVRHRGPKIVPGYCA